MDEWIETWERVKEEFNLSPWQGITNPGKFEGESLLAPFFYEVSMISGQDETLYNQNEDVFCVFKTESWLGQNMPEDFEKAVKDYACQYFVLSETDDGFVALAAIVQDEYDMWLEELEAENV